MIEMTKMLRTRRGLAAMALIAALTAQGCKKKAADDADSSEKPTVTVQAEKVAIGSITETVQADSVLQPLAQASIVPKITAPVKKFMVQRGSRVRAGQVLAVLENADLAAAVVDTRGSLTQAKANYDTVSKATIVEDMTQAQTNADQTKAALDVQRQQTDSRAKLLQEGAIPRRDYETSRAALVQAQASYDQAAQHLASLKRVSQRATVETAQGGLVSAQGKYEQADANLGYATIRSPLSGLVTDRPLYAGETAQAGTPLVTVMDLSSVLAKVHLPQEEAARLHVGDKAHVAVQGTDQAGDGAVSLISPAADTGSTTIEVWVKVPNKDGGLKAGIPVHVSMETRTLENITTIPAESVITNKSGGTAVMVVGTDGLAHERDVTLGVSDGKDTQVISGVHPGEQVVTTGAHSLEDGTKVEVGPAEGDDEKKGGGDEGDKGAADEKKSGDAGKASGPNEGGDATAGKGGAAGSDKGSGDNQPSPSGDTGKGGGKSGGSNGNSNAPAGNGGHGSGSGGASSSGGRG